jgi:hypothetical protein
MGSGGQITPVHIDECENIMAIFSGRKVSEERKKSCTSSSAKK